MRITYWDISDSKNRVHDHVKISGAEVKNKDGIDYDVDKWTSNGNGPRLVDCGIAGSDLDQGGSSIGRQTGQDYGSRGYVGVDRRDGDNEVSVLSGLKEIWI